MADAWKERADQVSNEGMIHDEHTVRPHQASAFPAPRARMISSGVNSRIARLASADEANTRGAEEMLDVLEVER